MSQSTVTSYFCNRKKLPDQQPAKRRKLEVEGREEECPKLVISNVRTSTL